MVLLLLLLLPPRGAGASTSVLLVGGGALVVARVALVLAREVAGLGLSGVPDLAPCLGATVLGMGAFVPSL